MTTLIKYIIEREKKVRENERESERDRQRETDRSTMQHISIARLTRNDCNSFITSHGVVAIILISFSYG